MTLLSYLCSHSPVRLSIASLHLVLVGNQTVSGMSTTMMWNASRILSSFHFLLFKSIKGFSLRIFVESSCLVLQVQSSLSASQLIKLHPMFFNELLTVLSGKVHKVCICSTEEKWLDTGMASEIIIQGCFCSSSHMFLKFFHRFVLFFLNPNQTKPKNHT